MWPQEELELELEAEEEDHHVESNAFTVRELIILCFDSEGAAQGPSYMLRRRLRGLKRGKQRPNDEGQKAALEAVEYCCIF